MRIVNATGVTTAGGTRLRVEFSDASCGIADFAAMLAEGGPMVEPLRDPEMFQRVFIQCGTLTWPNGFDLDSIRLHAEMAAAGLLNADAASEPAAAK